MNNEIEIRAALDKQPTSLRTFDLAKKVNTVMIDVADEALIAPFAAPFDSYLQYKTQYYGPAPKDWEELMLSLAPRQLWSVKEFLGKFIRKQGATHIGHIRNICAVEGTLFYGIAPKSLLFGYVAFEKRIEEDPNDQVVVD